MRFTLTALAGFGFDGGHLDQKGLSPTGQVVRVPTYRHRVTLDYTRVEVAALYTFAEDWDVWLRVPYEVKRQVATFELVEPATRDEVLAMDRSRRLHHDSATYEGLSDLMLLVAHRERSVLVDGDLLSLAVGLTLPTGQTERDPYETGEAGQKHQHIQFGTGTVDPLLEAAYRLPLPEAFAVDGFAAARLPFYENPKSFRGPPELTAGVRLVKLLADVVELQVGATYFRQWPASWDGDRDENTGLHTVLADVGVVLRAGGLLVSAGARLPLFQETFVGEAFEQGPSLLLSIGWALP